VKLSRTAAVSAAVTVAAAAVAAAVVTLTSASARTAASHPRQVSAAAARPAAAGQVGWQGLYAYGVPTGTNTLFFHYSCPGGLIASSGGFQFQNGPPTALAGDGPRWDSGYNRWDWFFNWPAGSPAGESIDFDVYCAAGPA
jgi:hypothetical protein